MRRASLAAALLLLFVTANPVWAQRLSVTESVHNLSPSGPGSVKAVDGYACVFCHAPHHVLPEKAPLWNHELSTQVYAPYTSSTYQQSALQPQVGSTSKLCLSCHDGTVALGQTVSRGSIPVTGGMDAVSNLGTDLRGSHPLSFSTPFVDSGELSLSLLSSPPRTRDPQVQLVGDRVECTTCHEPHTPNLDPVVQKFLVRDSSNGQLCLACHDPDRPTATHLRGWTTSQHALATHSAGGNVALGGYSTVAGNACISCHTPHGGAASGRLLRNTEEATCAACHHGTNLTPPLPDVMGSFEQNQYRHPVELTGLHDPAENSFPLSTSRHAECADCHNAHAAQGGGASAAPASQPALSGASGVAGMDGTTAIPRAVNQYEVCFKCHGNSSNKPQSESFLAYGRTAYRQTFPLVADPYNVRLDFLSQVARHSVMQPARAGTSPSLRANALDLNGNPSGRSLAAGTYLYCSDCHNNDNARALGGAAANGPHGSRYEHILERRYELEPVPATPGASTLGVGYAPGLSGAYALCDKCHDVDNRLLSSDTVFGRHQMHVVDQRASCATCHAPHGVQGGNPQFNAHLLNPDIGIVGPNQFGVLRIDTAARTCSLACHGKDHSNTAY